MSTTRYNTRRLNYETEYVMQYSPENADKQLYIHISVHGNCEVYNDLKNEFKPVFFKMPSFKNFTYVRTAAIGSVNYGLHNDNFPSVKMNGNLIPQYYYHYNNVYNGVPKNRRDEYLDPHLLSVPYDDIIDNIDDVIYKEYEMNRNKMYHNPKYLLDKELKGDMNNEGINQITVIIDGKLMGILEPSVIMRPRTRTSIALAKAMNNGEYPMKLSDLINYVKSMGFENVTIVDDSCSSLISVHYDNRYKMKLTKKNKRKIDDLIDLDMNLSKPVEGGRRRRKRRKSVRRKKRRSLVRP